MKHRLLTRMISVMLCSGLLLTACSVPGSGTGGNHTTGAGGSEAVTIEKAADYLYREAAKYQKSVPEKEELMESLPGQKEKGGDLRIQVLVMVSRAFGELPKPTGNQERLAPKDINLENVPQEARADLEKLNAAGVLAQSDLGQGKSDPMSKKELHNIVRRIYALYGTNLKDDFYSAVNKNELDTKEIPAGETDAGGTYDQTIQVQNQVRSIIKKIVEGDGYTPGSREAKIKAFYESAVDFQKRNALGAGPLKKYMDAIDQADTLKELSDAQILSSKEIACGSFFPIMYLNDPRDSDKMIATLTPPVEGMNDESDTDHLIRLLTLSGETKGDAKVHVEAYLNLVKKAAETKITSADPEYVSVKELQKIFPDLDVEGIIRAGGDSIPKELCLQMPEIFRESGKIFGDKEYLPALKTALKLQIINTTYTYLSQDFLEAFDEYNQRTMGQAPDNSTPEEMAYAMVQNTLGDYIDRLYAKEYFSPEAKKAVEDMIVQFINVYKERVQKLDWMSEETKAAAIRKLDTMKFYIGYPEKWDDTMDQLEITDNYFQNQVNALKLMQQRVRDEAEAKMKGNGRNDMKIPVATVNAYYDQHSNSMCFPAGILQAPSFDVNASLEENLGGIGTTIAHEISHAFDNNGAKFDENGSQRDWWEKSDYAKFQELCQEAVNFYNGFESAPGIAINGEQTLGENIADIGGVACALDVLKQKEDPDYDKFFRAYTQGWLKCTTRARAESLAEVDEHSPSILRVNRVLANFQEFYDTYGVKEGDGMYVPESERIKIW